MKKFLTLLVVSCFVVHSYADEGMWLPYLLGKKTYDNMVKRGLKLSKEQLYSINKPSIKDAIVIFGGGCTGEIVSDKGLIFTNHHCGYGAIADASTLEHNYLRDGFYAKNFGQEIPSKGLSVKFLDRIEDVSDQFTAALKNLSGEERQAKGREISESIKTKAAGNNAFLEASVVPFYKGNQYLLFVYKVYKDIRLVATPPESVGKFGGDTDNWEWPRHTGDFSVFRVYAGKDGSPAEYAAANVPYKPKYYLPVSIKGVKENDYAMIFGYPGGTNRYETSYGIQLKNDIENPDLVKLREVRLKYMKEEMKKSDATRLQLSNAYAGIANYWKFFDGESKQLKKHGIFEKKKTQETKFSAWAKNKPEYSNILNEYQKAYADWTPMAKQRVYLLEGIYGSPVVRSSQSILAPVQKALKDNNKDALLKVLKDAEAARARFLENENIASDKNIAAAMAEMYYTDIAKSQHPKGLYEAIAQKYGDLNEKATFKKWAEAAFESSLLLHDDKWKRFVANPHIDQLNSDLIYAYGSAFSNYYQDNVAQANMAFTYKINDLGRQYIKGSQEMNPNQENYPDANFTMRISYGQIKAYKPADAKYYDYATTMKGVMEKYIPNDYEFDLPKKQIELYNKKDFGQYKDPKYNDVVTGFISTNDITGGNSGSPVLNANGELIGLAFDGNYEALSHKIAFDEDLNRTISVDVRYVLWVLDKLGNARNIINELKIVK